MIRLTDRYGLITAQRPGHTDKVMSQDDAALIDAAARVIAENGDGTVHTVGSAV